MYAYGMRGWRNGNTARHIYRYNHEEHEHRIGHCPWRPEDGDLCVCIEAAGDCFDNYVAMRQRDDGMYEVVGEFGAYIFGESCGELSKRDFHLLQAGEPISVEID